MHPLVTPVIRFSTWLRAVRIATEVLRDPNQASIFSFFFPFSSMEIEIKMLEIPNELVVRAFDLDDLGINLNRCYDWRCEFHFVYGWLSINCLSEALVAGLLLLIDSSFSAGQTCFHKI